MNIPTCPHCYRRVIPDAKGICPSCNKDVNDRRLADPNKALIGLRAGGRMPRVCHRCGNPTSDFCVFEAESETSDAAVDRVTAGFLAKFLGPLGRLIAKDQAGPKLGLSIRVPTCKPCKKRFGPISPNYIDFENKRIDLVVHTEFINAMRGLGESPV